FGGWIFKQRFYFLERTLMDNPYEAFLQEDGQLFFQFPVVGGVQGSADGDGCARWLSHYEVGDGSHRIFFHFLTGYGGISFADTRIQQFQVVVDFCGGTYGRPWIAGDNAL